MAYAFQSPWYPVTDQLNTCFFPVNTAKYEMPHHTASFISMTRIDQRSHNRRSVRSVSGMLVARQKGSHDHPWRRPWTFRTAKRHVLISVAAR